MKKILVPVLAFVAGMAVGAIATKTHCRSATLSAPIVVDTVVVRDTLRIHTVHTPTVRRAAGTLTLPVTYTMAPPSFTAPAPAATLTDGGDSVALTREVRVYTDSTYRAVVSGVCPSLDSLTIYPATRIVTRTLPASASSRRCFGNTSRWGLIDPSRWGLGVTLGVAATPRGLTPALTLGLTYRLR